jgi:4-amino-4-deoxy-L-arabinose transferase-like glycosyltransferase
VIGAQPNVRRWLWLILALALIIRLGYVYVQLNHHLFHVATFAPDSDRYIRMAGHILNQAMISYDGRSLTAGDVPGFPLFLAGLRAVFGPGLIWIYLAQVILSAATVLLVYLIGSELFSAKAGLIAAAFASVAPLLLLFVATPLSEVLYTFLATAFLALYVRARRSPAWALAAGLVGGAAVMTRPVLAIFVGLLGLIMLARKGRRGLGLALLAGFALVLAPWVIRNAVAFGEFIPLSSRGGFEFYLGNAADSTGGTGGHLAWGSDVKMPPGPAPGVSENAWSGQLARQAIDNLITQPGLFWQRLPGKIWNMWRPTWAGASMRNLVMVGGIYIVLVCLALLCPFSAACRKRSGVLWGYLGYHVLVHALIYGIVRYRIPVEPVLCVLAGQGLALLTGSRSKHRGLESLA